MNKSLTNRSYFIILAAVFVLALVSDLISESELKYSLQAKAFENKLQAAEREAIKYLEDLATGDASIPDPGNNPEMHENRIISLYKYSGGRLTAWTNNSFALPEEYDAEFFKDKLVRLDNRIFVASNLHEGEDIYLCLVNVFREYDIGNKYLRSGFNPELGLKVNAALSTEEDSAYPVLDTDGQYLFSLVFDPDDSFISGIRVIPMILWIIFFIAYLVMADRITMWLAKKGYTYTAFIASVQAVMLLYLIFLLGGKPDIFYEMEVFSSFRFNIGPLIPSPGHLLMLSVLFLFVCLEFYRFFPAPGCNGEKPYRDFAVITSFFSLAVIIFFIYSRLLHVLVLNSNIHFRIFEVLDIDIFSIISMTAAALIIVGLSIYLLRIVAFCRGIALKTLLPALFFSLLVLFLLNLLTGQSSLVHAIVFLLIVLQAWFFRSERSRLINVSVTFAIIAAAYSSYLIPGLTSQKETEKLKVISVNFSNHNDIYGEALLLDLWSELRADTILPLMMSGDFMSSDEVLSVYNYLDREYFYGYWDTYDHIYTICEDDSPLYFESDTGRVENCFDFFQTRAKTMGIPVIDSNLVFLDNSSGRPYYLGCLYFEKNKGKQNGLFVELVNLVRYTQSGYPELLIDEEYDKRASTGDYSIAKYINDSLVLQTGEHPFDNHLRFSINDSTAFTTVPADSNTDYFIYSDERVSVVVARPRITFIDIVITFTHLFVAFFILCLVMLLIVRPPLNIFTGRMNFTQKLQFAFVGMLLGSLVAIGTVVVILSINQYREKHYENIEEKLGSVSIELEHKLSELDTLGRNWSAEGYPGLDALLVKFSNVFKTDINLYDTGGELLATSRREVFDNNLKSKRMNYSAFSHLKYHGQSQFIHFERIGQLEYLSAYSPFVNDRNKVLAYLNLPYFNMQSRISEDTSNMIVAMINFSMILLVISLSIAVFISVRITNPLRMLQQGLASVRLEEKSKPLEYSGHDEIAELVKQYNIMLDELQASALKLARSEREDAWREMAKQIAHEIKNPLTPMKLNVQQLYKKWKDSPENFGESLKSFKQYQIEQIDNLSSIATEFSNFARMPKASPRETDLINHISAVAELYNDIKNVELGIDFSGLKEVKVFADKEQMHSMLSNILRNAVQAIPGNRKGLINIGLSVSEQKALIRIEDNGVGIPWDLQDKLFTPNFTTKSSGMGLGLSIVKRVVETANGRVWFESEPGRGTIFYVEYPVLSYRR